MPPPALAARALPVAVVCAAAALAAMAASQRARDLTPAPAPPLTAAPPALPPGGLDHRPLPAAPAPR